MEHPDPSPPPAPPPRQASNRPPTGSEIEAAMGWAEELAEPAAEGSGDQPQVAPAVPAPTQTVGASPLQSAAEAPRELSTDIASSNPRDPEQQSELLGRLRELRNSLPREASEQQVALDLAMMLTQHLISMGGLGPEDLLQMVARMVKEVELGTGQLVQKRRCGVVLSSEGVSTEGLRLVGKVGENGKLLGEIMIQLGFATREQIDEAARTQRAAGVRLGEALVSSGVATWAQVRRAVSVQGQLRL